MKKKFMPIAIALVGIIVGYILLNPIQFGICKNVSYYNGIADCLDGLKGTMGSMIELFSLPLFAVSILLLFVRDELYDAWFNFAKWWLPISFLFILKASPYGGAFLGPSEEQLAIIFFLGGFLVISFIILIWKAFEFRQKSKEI